LPASLEGEAIDSHAVDSTTRPRSLPWLLLEAISGSVASTGELNDKTFTHKFGSVLKAEMLVLVYHDEQPRQIAAIMGNMGLL
jgi:hypothetical protein